MKNIKLLCFGVLAIALLVIFWASERNTIDLPESSFQILKQPLPEIDLLTVDERQPLPKSPFTLVIWATWCPTCVAEHHYLIEVAKDIPLVGIVLRDDADKVRQFLKDRGNPFIMNFNDVNGKLSQKVGAQGTPTILFVDGDKIVRARLTGGLNKRKWIDKNLKEFAVNL